jgi:hypothetical protein
LHSNSFIALHRTSSRASKLATPEKSVSATQRGRHFRQIGPALEFGGQKSPDTVGFFELSGTLPRGPEGDLAVHGEDADRPVGALDELLHVTSKVLPTRAFANPGAGAIRATGAARHTRSALPDIAPWRLKNAQSRAAHVEAYLEQAPDHGSVVAIAVYSASTKAATKDFGSAGRRICDAHL